MTIAGNVMMGAMQPQENNSARYLSKPPTTAVVLVGHCGFDRGGLTRMVQHAAPGVRIDSARDLDALQRFADQGALLLINRIPEGQFGGLDGIALIQHLGERAANADQAPRAMLISNYAESQAQAEASGAYPGFGKSQMSTATSRQRLLVAMAD